MKGMVENVLYEWMDERRKEERGTAHGPLPLWLSLSSYFAFVLGLLPTGRGCTAGVCACSYILYIYMQHLILTPPPPQYIYAATTKKKLRAVRYMHVLQPFLVTIGFRLETRVGITTTLFKYPHYIFIGLKPDSVRPIDNGRRIKGSTSDVYSDGGKVTVSYNRSSGES